MNVYKKNLFYSAVENFWFLCNNNVIPSGKTAYLLSLLKTTHYRFLFCPVPNILLGSLLLLTADSYGTRCTIHLF